MPTNSLSPRGDDEELKEALRAHRMASGRWYGQPAGSGTYDAEVWDAETAIESLFGRIKEERDRLEAECLMELLHEPTGKMLPVRVRTVVKALEAELGRIREELKEALAEVDRLHALSLRLRA